MLLCEGCDEQLNLSQVAGAYCYIEPGALMAVNHVLDRWLGLVASRLSKTDDLDPPTLVSLDDLQAAVMECVVHGSKLALDITKSWEFAQLGNGSFPLWAEGTNLLDTLPSLHFTNRTSMCVFMAMHCVTENLVVRFCGSECW
jgi:hypothetical protein